MKKSRSNTSIYHLQRYRAFFSTNCPCFALFLPFLPYPVLIPKDRFQFRQWGVDMESIALNIIGTLGVLSVTFVLIGIVAFICTQFEIDPPRLDQLMKVERHKQLPGFQCIMHFKDGRSYRWKNDRRETYPDGRVVSANTRRVLSEIFKNQSH